MSWLKIDDGFPTHPKVLKLPRNDRWTWLELLAYCSRHDNDAVPPAIVEVIPKASSSFLKKCETAGLLDVNGDGCYHVHGFGVYNGKTVEDKVRAYLDQHPDASANEVAKKVGGHRQDVLREIEKQRQGGS